MGKTICLFINLLFYLCSNAQKEIDSSFSAETCEASFPEGRDSLQRFINRRYIIPDSLLADGSKRIQGIIVASFIVGKDGTVSKCQIIKSLHPALDDELLRVLRLIPSWKPAKFNGVAIEEKYIQSITIEIIPD